jgi:hypothetical protein
MRNNERLIASGQVVSDGVGQVAIREEFDNHGSIQPIIVSFAVPVLSAKGSV